MKKLAAVLFSFALLHAQALALSGGPQYPGGTTSITGTYAGVLIPTEVGDDLEDLEGLDAVAGSLGLFSLSVPNAGIADGSFFLFDGGLAYVGQINGFANATSGKISGVLRGNPSSQAGDTTFTFLGLFASGFISAEVVQTNDFFTNTAAVLEGEANIAISTIDTTVDFDEEADSYSISDFSKVDKVLSFVVDGVRQSSATGAAATFGADT